VSVLTTAELAAYIDVVEDAVPMQRALDDAEAAVCAHLGCVGLESEIGATDTLTKGMAGTLLPMYKGLVVALTAITVDGVTIDETDVQVDYWSLYYSSGFGKNALVAATFNRGFVDSSGLPIKLLSALLYVSRWTWEQGHQGRQVTGESLGDWSATHGQVSESQRDAVPDHAINLLVEFVRPTL